MGVTVAAAARSGGHRVVWASAGRSEATARRAAQAGLDDARTLTELCASSDIVLSVSPPDAAVDVAGAVAESRFGGIFVDANAISPGTMHRVADVVAAGGADVVDGGIVGPPAHRSGTTRLYLSGPRADEVAGVFAESALEAVVVGEALGAASALKMCYAAYTKGAAALLLAVVALARSTEVEAPLLAEWDRSQPGLRQRSETSAAASAPKAWRWTGEMAEIAATFEQAGLPSGFHRAACEVFERLSGFRDSDEVDLDAVVDALTARAQAAVRPPAS
jgi:3-hydroxyisobutyrate dehydrogenase-like beta-hydroxyacid dehydrogenase